MATRTLVRVRDRRWVKELYYGKSYSIVKELWLYTMAIPGDGGAGRGEELHGPVQGEAQSCE